MIERVDVIIVGARCAGASLAVLLARLGLRVVVLEREAHLEDTRSNHMFEADALAFLDRLGLSAQLRATGAPLITQADMRIEDVHVQIHLPQRPGDIGAIASIRRSRLDSLLAQAASEAGADVYMKAKVTGLLMEASRVTGVRYCEGEREHKLRARLVVGADGCRSTVADRVRARRYHLTRRNQRMVCWAYYLDAQLGPKPTLLNHRFDDQFFGALPSDGGLYQVIALPGLNQRDRFHADRNAAFDRLVRAYEPIEEAIAGARQVGDAKYVLKWTGYLREAWGPGWALIGDAGHFKSPAAGRGIGDAFLQAESLAACLAIALTGPDDALDQALRLWGRRRDREFAEHYWLACDLEEAGTVPKVLVEIFRSMARNGEAGLFFELLNHRLRPSQVLTPQHALAATVRLLASPGADRRAVLGEISRIGMRELRRRWLNVRPAYEPDLLDAWLAAAGTAGQAQPDELDEGLAGREPGIFDSALERATRSR